MKDAPRRRGNFTPQVESLETLTLLSGLSTVAHPVAAVVSLSKPVVLDLTTTGPFAYTQANPDTGKTYYFIQYGYTKALGNFGVTGSAGTLGFIASGHATGTLTFLTTKGKLTLQLTGPKQPGFAPLPTVFAWKVVAGTGGFSGAVGGGTVTVALHQTSSQLTSGGGTAVMTFHTNGKA